MAFVRSEEVLRYLGYSGQDFDGSLRNRIDGLISRCEVELAPKGMFAVFPIAADVASDDLPQVRVEGTNLVLEGRSVAEYLHGASHCALMACTLGMESERGLRRYGVTNQLDQLIYSCVCSEMVECEADDVERQVAEYAEKHGLIANYRFSPGYGDLSLGVQSKLVKVLGADKALGISVTDENFLIPMKSITAIVGLHPEKPAEAKVGCQYCNCRDFCAIRKSGGSCFHNRKRL